MSIKTVHTVTVEFDDMNDEMDSDQFARFEQKVKDICTVFNLHNCLSVTMGVDIEMPSVVVECVDLEVAEAIEKKIKELVAEQRWTIVWKETSMSIKVVFQVEVEFIDSTGEDFTQDQELQIALEEAFETENEDLGTFDFMPPIRGFDEPVRFIPGSLIIQYDDISDAIKADAKIQEIVKKQGFLVIETD